MNPEGQKDFYQFDDATGGVYFDYVDNVNYAMQYNLYPTLLKCVIVNDSDSDFKDIQISVSGDFIKERIAKIEALSPKSRVDVSDSISIEADLSELVNITEGVNTCFTLSVTVGESVVLSRDFQIRLMAYDYFLGPSLHPELLAAFMAPNHPLLSRVTTKAASFMETWTGSSAMDEYQSLDPNRVRMQVAAIYEALRSEEIVYATPPASYERSGQRIRMADKVLTERLGTCVDLSLLVASCLESIGINPILIILKGHCLVGAWLVRDSYLKTVGDDADFLLKTASDGINEIVMLESTCIASSGAVSFDDAVLQAQMKVSKEDSLIAFVDVYRARIDGVHPLPQRVMIDGAYQVENQGVAHVNATSEVRHFDRFDLSAYNTDSTKVTRYTIWERKLLDFSLRNNLLDIKFGKRVIPLVSFSIDRLEDALQAGESFTVYPFPTKDMPQPSDGGLYRSTKYPKLEEFIVNELSQHRLHSFLDDISLKESLKTDYRESRTSIEENGANNLYLVLGVMRWLETERSTKYRYAPILLLPIEIKRGGGVAGYVIRTRDEDIVLNITLAQFLKQQHDVDLSVLDELPTDHSGVDVKKIFAIIRDKIRTKKGWNVLDEALIGLFSFSKFVMWNDIHSNSELMHQNQIISSLVDGRLNLEDSADDVDVREYDRTTSPSELVLPIDVDSSQLEAVIASGEGKSFILYGPPGTGKSQTITNMIANALYHGKRVLFVAEKMAALSVVQARLEKIGLAPFCLELHSNKVTKQHFLSQMEEALSVTKTRTPAEYQHKAEELFAKRKEIIGYIDALHAKEPDGLSLYECITAFLSIDDVFTVELNVDDFRGFTREKIDEIKERIIKIDNIFKIAGKPSEHPLRGIDIIDGSMPAEQRFVSDLKRIEMAADLWQQCAQTLSAFWGDLNFDSRSIVDFTPHLISVLLSMPYANSQLLMRSLDGRELQSLADAVSAGMAADQAKRRLCATFSDRILDADVQSFKAQWTAINESWILSKLIKRNAFLKSMASYKPGCKAADVDEMFSLFDEYQRKQKAYDELQPLVSSLFQQHAYYGREDWQLMLDTIKALPVFVDMSGRLAQILGCSTKEAASKIASGVGDRWSILTERLAAIKDKALNARNEILESLSDIGGVIKFGNSESLTLISSLSVQAKRWLSGASAYKDWYRWSTERQWLQSSGLSDIARLLSAGTIDPCQAAEVFAKSVYRTIAVDLINTNEQLRYFNGLLFNDTIKKYREVTSQFQLLSKQMLYCKLASMIPSQTMEASANAEIGILKRNIKNGGRGTSIRKIIDQIPTLLPRLCPCMLMSPLSVAQYIDLKNEKFDIVIFDEASQMPTSEAVGAIARGKSLVVVGDDKQMPPTSFFSASSVSEDEAYIDDMDSILDDCISLSIPSKYLSWHYRSRHESLIAFSNSQYYDGRLFTFPSVDDRISKVTMRHIDGVYDKGKSRSNVDEARAVVAEVLRRLADPELSKLSIGIVSFSKVQQNLIEDILTEELSKHPDFESLAYNSAEPILVKNLENVQGDERDVILFSVGYGPDKNGAVSMNFGPLNTKGGERRLNVAVSRSRYEMVVFSSLTSDMIDLRRTQALGVVGLKKFLEFAESGVAVVPAALSTAAESNRVAQQIAQLLKEHGYESQLNVGRSQFRIDVAVADPQQPDRFILAILCDGPSYYATKTVRDREVVQSAVLQHLSWNVLRVWTLDWFERRETVINDILNRLKEIKNDKPKPTAPQSEDVVIDEPMKDNAGTELVDIETSPAEPYEQAKYVSRHQLSQADDLTLYRKDLTQQLRSLIDTEQPITSGLIYKRVVKAWGLTRVSPKVQSFVDSVLTSMDLFSMPNGDNGRVYWISSDAADDFGDIYRVNSQREISDVPYIEIENAMRYTISQQIAIEREDLKRLTAGLLGFARLGNNITAATEYALMSLIDRGVVIEDGSKIKIGDRPKP